jgi:protein O-mannosyl-transferase
MAKTKVAHKPALKNNGKQQPFVKQTTSERKEWAGPTRWILTLGIFAASFILYSGTFHHKFVLDDYGIIVSNKYTRMPFSWENTKIIFSTPLRYGFYGNYENTLYRPLVKLLFNVEVNMLDGTPYGFHVVNVILYSILCMVIFLVLYDVFQRKWLLPTLATLLFVVHPIHTEVVANIKSADEILGLLGIVLAIRCVQLYFNSQNKIYLPLAVLSYLVALFSKESSVVGVGLVAIFIFFFTNATLKKNVVISGMLLFCALFFLACRSLSLEGLHKMEFNGWDNILFLCRDSAEKFATSISLLGLYIQKFILPFPLSCDYSYSVIKPVGTNEPSFLISLVILVSMLIYSIKNFMKKDLVAFGFIWFFVGFSLTSNIFFPIGISFAERLFFLPSLGLCLSAVLLINRFILKIQKINTTWQLTPSKYLAAAMIPVFLVYSVKTYSRSMDWKNDYNLYTKDLGNYPNATHLLFYVALGLADPGKKELLNEELTELGYTPKQIEDSFRRSNQTSIDYLMRSQAIYPVLPTDAFGRLGDAYYNLGRMDSAFKYFEKAYSLDSSNATFIDYLGLIRFNTQRIPEALPYFFKAHNKDTNSAYFMNNIGCAYGALLKPDTAIYWFEKALSKDSLNITSLQFLDITWRNLGNIAIADRYKELTAKAKITRKEQRNN